MDWLAPVVVRLTQLGPWAPAVFILLYIAAALTLAPAFLLTVAAGENVMRVLPPLIIEESHVAEFVEGLSAAAAQYELPAEAA